MMKMEFEYPTLVEQMYKAMRAQHLAVTKQEVYTQMIEAHMIDENGNPTQMAVDNGLIEGYQTNSAGELEPISLVEFKRQNPGYAQFDDCHFTHTAEGWAVDGFIVRAIANFMLADPNTGRKQRKVAKQMLKKADKMEAGK